MSDSVYFFQPSIGIEAKVKPNKGRAKTVKKSSHCRALLNTSISNQLKSAFVKTVTTYRTIPAVNNNYGYNYPERKEAMRSYQAKAELGEKGLDFPAILSMSVAGLRTYAKKKVKDPWGYGNQSYTTWSPVKGPIPKVRMKDFFYLADLLCGTLSVLLTPEDEDTHWRRTPVPRELPTRLEYLGVSSLVLLSPALTALFFGQLRLAAFLASAGKADELRKVAPEGELRKALSKANREQCVAFLEAAKPWILRKESGLWAFTNRSKDRFERLLRYFDEGGDVGALFSKNILKSWALLGDSPYGTDFHGRGFNDYMGQQGSGDKKVLAALAKMKKAA